jgi:phospholipid/cholesterol/gamma-HCH transport system substrate-binding protein
MSDRRKAVKVGIFTFATGALLAIILVVFGGLKFWKHHDRYFIVFDDSVMGLSDGTKVYFNGIKVGTVGEIKLDKDDPSKVRVSIEVDRGTPIRTDTVAMLSMGGLTGLKTLDLQGGSSKAALPPESTITVGHGALDKLEKQAEKLADNSGKMIERATEIMEGANKIVINLQAITDPKGIGAIVESTKQTADNLNHASQEVNAMVAEDRIALKGAVDSLKGTMVSLKGTSDSLHVAVDSAAKTSENANGVVSDVKALIHNNEATITSMMADLRQAARGFKELAREVREKPSRLLLSDSPPERKLP